MDPAFRPVAVLEREAAEITETHTSLDKKATQTLKTLLQDEFVSNTSDESFISQPRCAKSARLLVQFGNTVARFHPSNKIPLFIHRLATAGEWETLV